ncbi:MAG: hypothetical protein LC749_10695, partial [Actinobacteria bacterium]|nr:hypothetical protein [Actinomycetota bacterium]
AAVVPADVDPAYYRARTAVGRLERRHADLNKAEGWGEWRGTPVGEAAVAWREAVRKRDGSLVQARSAGLRDAHRLRKQSAQAAEREPQLRERFEALAAPERARLKRELPQAKKVLADLEGRRRARHHFEFEHPEALRRLDRLDAQIVDAAWDLDIERQGLDGPRRIPGELIGERHGSSGSLRPATAASTSAYDLATVLNGSGQRDRVLSAVRRRCRHMLYVWRRTEERAVAIPGHRARGDPGVANRERRPSLHQRPRAMKPIPGGLRVAVYNAMGGWGPYTVRQIAELFLTYGFSETSDAAGDVGGARRSAAEAYQRCIDWDDPDRSDLQALRFHRIGMREMLTRETIFGNRRGHLGCSYLISL